MLTLLVKQFFLLFTVLAVILPIPAFAQAHNCDFGAVVARNGYMIYQFPDGMFQYDDPDDFYYEFVRSTSSLSDNDDGYGLIYYSNGVLTVPFTQQSNYFSTTPYYGWPPALLNPGPFNAGWLATFNITDPAVMVMSHARNGTGGSGNHPFLFDFDGRTYAFMHNGWISNTVKNAIWNELYNLYGAGGGQWFIQHPSNWLTFTQCSNPANFVDTELLFHWIMYNIINYNGSEFSGLYHALNSQVRINSTPPYFVMDLGVEFYQNYASNIINFVLSDGDSLYVYRNSPINGNNYNISYLNYNNQFVGVKTDATPAAATQIEQFQLVHIARDVRPLEFDDFPNFPFADIQITVSDSPDPVPVGDTLTYTLYITNNGPLDATNVHLTGELPDEIPWALFSTNGMIWQIWTDDINIGTCPAYTSRVCYVQGDVTNVGPDRLLKYIAKISSADIRDPQSRNNFDTASTAMR